MTAMIPIPIEDPLSMAWLDCNDLGNAERLVRLSRGLLRWVEKEEKWIAFDGRRWSMRDGDHLARQKAHDVARHIDAEATALAAILGDARALSAKFGDWCTTELATERVIVLRKHALKSGNAAQTGAMLVQAREALRIDPDQFNTDPLAFNVRNGTLRFRREKGKDGKPGAWRIEHQKAHDPTDFITQLADVDFDPEADCPKWKSRFELAQPDAEQRAVLPLVYGMTLTGLVSDQAFYVFQGKGGDGKSTSNDVIGEILGDYFSHAPIATFLEGPKKGGSEHRSDLVRLQGDIRMVLADEPKKSDTWDGSVLKQITGGKITARGFQKATEETFTPRWKLFVECNPLPRAPSDDEGFKRRMKLYLWPFQFTKSAEGADPIDVVKARLRAEKSGILNWMIEGALRWLETRVIPEPAVMREALGNYWAAASPLTDWMGDYCDLSDRHATEPAADLHRHFCDWCERQGIDKPMNATSFGRALTERHIMRVKDGRGNIQRRGIRLRSEIEVEAAAAAAADEAARRAGLAGAASGHPAPLKRDAGPVDDAGAFGGDFERDDLDDEL